MTYSRAEVEAARERLRVILRSPSVVDGFHYEWELEELAALGAHIEALEGENERLRRFVREVLYDYLEIDKSSQCPWCLWIPGRSWQPIHECSAIEMIQAVGLRSLLPEARDE